MVSSLLVEENAIILNVAYEMIHWDVTIAAGPLLLSGKVSTYEPESYCSSTGQGTCLVCGLDPQ